MPPMRERRATGFAMLGVVCLLMAMTLGGCVNAGQGRGALTGLCDGREPFVRDHASALADLPPSGDAQRAQRTGRVLIGAVDEGCGQ